MAAIGTGWADGAWVEAGWVANPGAWASETDPPAEPSAEPSDGGGGGAGEPGGGISGRASRQYPSYGTNMPGVGEEAPTPAKSVPVDAKAKIEQVDLRIEELRALKAEAEADESRIALLGVTLEKLEEELRLALRRRAMLLLLILISNEVF